MHTDEVVDDDVLQKFGFKEPSKLERFASRTFIDIHDLDFEI